MKRSYTCNDSQIPYLGLRELHSLRTLDLEGNNITKMANNQEVKFSSEMDLILSNNRIRHIDDDAFDSFESFSRLDLSYNQVLCFFRCLSVSTISCLMYLHHKLTVTLISVLTTSSHFQ